MITNKVPGLTWLVLFTVFAVQFTGINGQQNQVLGSASFSVSAGSIEDLQSQIEQEAQNAFSQLQSDSSDNELQQVVTSLTQTIAQAIASILVNLLQEGNEVNNTEVASQVSTAVSGALSTAASSAGGQLAGLDVKGIQNETFVVVQSTLNDATEDTSVANITQTIAQSVKNTVGNSLAAATGGTFSGSVQVTQRQVAAAIDIGEVVLADISGEARNILQDMVDQNCTGAASRIDRLINQASFNEIVNAINASLTQGLDEELSCTLTALYKDQTSEITPFSLALGIAYDTLNQSALLNVLSQTFQNLNTDRPNNLDQATFFAIALQGSSAKQAFERGYARAFEQNGCEAIGLAILDSAKYADSFNMGSIFRTVLIQDLPELSQCFQVGYELEIAVNLLGSACAGTDVAGQLQDSLNEGNVTSVVFFINQMFAQGCESELEANLQNLYCDESGSRNFASQSLAAAIGSGESANTTISRALGSAFAQGNCTGAVLTLQVALSSAQAPEEEAAEKIIKDQIEGDVCGLESVVDRVIEEAADLGDERVLSLFRNDTELQQCASEDLKKTLFSTGVRE
eukprot:TRINITY_DN2267_c0_g1_i6.p1 TRINITY_DN2267_c0_g1~~TRINITY_DN2267_c0_g1_i6.p1  ORF type:complete len:573 (-),score=95.38 TRINITY_DN2267_c0_g1_i6:236-1954(-)